MEINARCTKGNSYNIELESDYSDITTPIKCLGSTDSSGVYIFESFYEIRDIVKNGKYLVVKTHMANGKYMISQFSLYGSLEVIMEMLADFEIRTGDKI